MPKTRGPYLGEAGRLELRLVTERRQREVHVAVAIRYLEEASDAAVVRRLLLPALQALKIDAGIGRAPAKRKRTQA